MVQFYNFPVKISGCNLIKIEEVFINGINLTTVLHGVYTEVHGSRLLTPDA
jgi:hypothetical protein